jgi:hypothetical protein
MDYINYLSNHKHYIRGIEQSSFDIKIELESILIICNRFNLDYKIFRELDLKLLKIGGYNLNRNDIIKLINSPDFSSKEKIVIILSWGIYFSYFFKMNQFHVQKFIQFLNTREELFFDKLIFEIQSIDFENRDGILQLYKKFQTVYKIDGIGYAYFTKLFFYFSKHNSLPILDNWLTKSFIFLILNDQSISETDLKFILKSIYNTDPFKEKNKNFRIKSLSRQPEFYYLYVKYLNDKSKLFNISTNELETFLFGWDLTKKIQCDYINPRIIYNNFFKEYFK